jgi:hypothetical protein
MTTAAPTVRTATVADLDRLPGLAVEVSALIAGSGYAVVATCRGAATILQITGTEREQAALASHIMSIGYKALAVAPHASTLDLVTALGLEPAPSREV